MKNIQIQYSLVNDFLVSLLRLNNNHCLENFVKNYEEEIKGKIRFNDDILQWLERTRNAITSEQMELMDLFFNNETYLRIAFFDWIYEAKPKNVSDFLALLKQKSGKELLRHYFALFVSNTHWPETVRNELTNVDIFEMTDSERMKFLEKFPFSAQRKWGLLQLCAEPERFLDALVMLLEDFYQNHFLQEEQKIAKLMKKYIKNLTRKIDAYGHEFLTLLLNRDYCEDIQQKEIRIELSYFLEISYLFFMRLSLNEEIYVIGYRHHEVFVEPRHGTLANVQVFKALGDETRQNIIRFLAKRDWYGDELAQKMKLSNSTVSYHLSLLMLEGIVSVKRIENRNYFALQKQRLSDLMQAALQRMIQ